jgi:hypothetical protein
LIRRPDLMKAIVQASEKDKAPKLRSLENFMENWDFVRFACLLEKLHKDPSLPDLKRIKEAVIACRSIRHGFAHNSHNPYDQGLPDGKFASILDGVRDWLPKLNMLAGDELNEIYDKVEVLESILFLRSQ